MYDALLVGVLQRSTDLHKQLQTIWNAQLFPITVFRDRHALHQFHGKVRCAVFRDPGIQYLGDVLMIHHRQRLAFGFKPSHYLFAVHARFDQLQRHPPT